MILPILEREKVNLKLPLFTLDVNQVALTDPSNWPPPMKGLAPLEWNYFEVGSIELCVTPQTPFEITKGQSTTSLPYTAYQRLKKSEFFKKRPPGITLTLSAQESNQLWSGIKGILWPTVSEEQLNQRQRADVSQLYFYTVSSGSTCENSAFLTVDQNFLNKRDTITRELGVTVLTPNEAWEEYHPKYNLYSPTQSEISHVLQEQRNYLVQMSTRSEIGL